MKISIGYEFIDGPWGGGNSFAIQLKNYLEENDIQVVNTLKDEDIDIILLTEPRRYTKSSSFNHIDVMKYIRNKNTNALVVNRINECDERKNTKGLNKFLINSSLVSDHTVFISEWLKNLFLSQNFNNESFSVIKNGADSKIFNFREKTVGKKYKIVTHHWSSDFNKGFEAYIKLDEILNSQEFNDNFEFIFIGNKPKNLLFKNTTFVDPLFGKNLSNILKECHIYITGSLNEPAGMHHIEGAMCGLPLLYIDSGGITEYCRDYGLDYEVKNLEEKLREIKNKYDLFLANLEKYPFTGDEMCRNYLNLFNDLFERKDSILQNRKNLEKLKLQNQYKLFNYYFYL